jgi:hypothetical protein
MINRSHPAEPHAGQLVMERAVAPPDEKPETKI